MKKLLNVAAVALALCGLMLTSCASGGDKGGAAESTHPRSYTFDVIDGGASTINMPWNQYGPNYQATPFFTGLVKKDKPKAGDTVIFKMKAVSNIDLPLLLAYPCSTAPSWTNLLGDVEPVTIAENVKAGEAFEVDVEFVLAKPMGSDFAFCMQYDNPDQDPKAGAAATLTLERVCESTDTTKEVPAAPHISNVTVDIGKYAAFLEIATNHPWVNGAQDMSVISNYQATPEVTRAWGDDLPIAGDTVTIVWDATSDIDISKIYLRMVDCSAAANWWGELNSSDIGYVDDKYVFITDIKAGEPFHAEMTLPVEVAPTAQVNFCMWYDIGDAEGPAICKFVRPE